MFYNETISIVSDDLGVTVSAKLWYFLTEASAQPWIGKFWNTTLTK